MIIYEFSAGRQDYLPFDVCCLLSSRHLGGNVFRYEYGVTHTCTPSKRQTVACEIRDVEMGLEMPGPASRASQQGEGGEGESTVGRMSGKFRPSLASRHRARGTNTGTARTVQFSWDDGAAVTVVLTRAFGFISRLHTRIRDCR